MGDTALLLAMHALLETVCGEDVIVGIRLSELYGGSHIFGGYHLITP